MDQRIFYNTIVYTPIILMVMWFFNWTEFKNLKSRNEITLQPLSSWEEGMLDIHHINTGSGDACFMILPDGTTLLFDAGKLNKAQFEANRAPLKITAPVPGDSLSAAEWIARYILKMKGIDSDPAIDYAVVSHFHGDHYGSLVELGNLVSIKNVFDRNFPEYNFPLDLKKYHSEDPTFQAYLKYLDKNETKGASLIPGKKNQLTLLHSPQKYPQFQITNVKANATIWTGKDEDVKEHFTAKEMTAYYKGKYNENPLSLALKISYGDFDYFTGGDNTGLKGYGFPEWFDVETPMAKAVGKVEALTLNHHGNRDATNLVFVETLNPKVVIQQLWCSDHPGQEVYQRLITQNQTLENREIFSTNMHPETLVTYGPWFRDNYKSMQGHILIRVNPGGKDYKVVIIDEASLLVKSEHGPYKSQ